MCASSVSARTRLRLCSVGYTLKLTMPNGRNRTPYRLREDDPQLSQPPSPIHTSDSDETYNEKRGYSVMRSYRKHILIHAFRVFRRCRRVALTCKAIKRGRLLPEVLRRDDVTECVSCFL